MLFHVAPDGASTEITVSNALFPNPYQLTDMHWRADSASFAFEYTRRGHQQAYQQLIRGPFEAARGGRHLGTAGRKPGLDRDGKRGNALAGFLFGDLHQVEAVAQGVCGAQAHAVLRA